MFVCNPKGKNDFDQQIPSVQYLNLSNFVYLSKFG